MPGTAPPTRACRKWRAPSRAPVGTGRASSACGTKRLESAHDAPSPEAVAVRDLHAPRPSTVLSRTSTPSTLGATLIFGCSLIGEGTDEAPCEVRAWLPRAWPTDALQWLPGLSLSVALIAPGASLRGNLATVTSRSR